MILLQRILLCAIYVVVALPGRGIVLDRMCFLFLCNFVSLFISRLQENGSSCRCATFRADRPWLSNDAFKFWAKLGQNQDRW